MTNHDEPRTGATRIAVLDVQRGMAILLIFFLNIPAMGNTIYYHDGDARLLGWRLADRACWWTFSIGLDGTQRGMLELLFGAGALILTRRTLEPQGPVEVADLYFRRNLWLAAFGLVDVFGIFWFGDILLPYALTAIFVFPFRKLSIQSLVLLGLLFASTSAIAGGFEYHDRAVVAAGMQQVEDKRTHHEMLDAADHRMVDLRSQQLASQQITSKMFADERTARHGSIVAYGRWLTGIWKGIVQQSMLPGMAEIFCSMLLGMALYKLGIIQGQRSSSFYLRLMLLCYGLGLTLRVIDTMQAVHFAPLPRIGEITGEFARLSVSIGHVSLINLLMKHVAGEKLLRPFKAAGRTAISLYIMQNVVGLWILFPGFGFGLWGHYGWFGLTVIAILVVAFELLLANLWLMRFGIGPVEWLWRSLAQKKLLPFRRNGAQQTVVF